MRFRAFPHHCLRSTRGRRRGVVLRALAAAAALGIGASASAERYIPFDARPEHPGIEGPQWHEAPTALPPAPADDASLVRIPPELVDSRYEYLLDADRVETGRDGVVRYMIVIRSKTGARNVYYEGLRCAPSEYKIYGIADSRGVLHPFHGGTWQPAAHHGPMAYREVLRSRYFCKDGGVIPLDTRGVRRRLAHLRVQGTPANRRDVPGSQEPPER